MLNIILKFGAALWARWEAQHLIKLVKTNKFLPSKTTDRKRHDSNMSISFRKTISEDLLT